VNRGLQLAGAAQAVQPQDPQDGLRVHDLALLHERQRVVQRDVAELEPLVLVGGQAAVRVRSLDARGERGAGSDASRCGPERRQPAPGGAVPVSSSARGGRRHRSHRAVVDVGVPQHRSPGGDPPLAHEQEPAVVVEREDRHGARVPDDVPRAARSVRALDGVDPDLG
jgi:hypothetical protein